MSNEPTHDFLRACQPREMTTPPPAPRFERIEPRDNFYRGPVREARRDDITPGEHNFGPLIGG